MFDADQPLAQIALSSSMLDLPNTIEMLSPLGLPLPSGHSRKIIADGVRGTEQTIALMQGMVNSYKSNNEIRELCGKILNPKDGRRPCQSKDYYCYAKTLYEWVRENILYAYDPHLKEYLESPSKILKNGIGDCDSCDMLLASMFEQVGLQAQFVTIMADPARPGEYTHVYVRVLVPKYGWITADPIMPEKYFGWEPPYPEGKRYWHASTDELNSPLDTSDSIVVPGDANSGMSGLANQDRRTGAINHAKRMQRRKGVSGLGHGGGHGGGGRRWGGGGYAQPYYGGGFDENIYVLPMAVVTTESFALVPADEMTAFQSRISDESSAPLTGMCGLGDTNKLSDSDTRALITNFVNGTAASFLQSKQVDSRKRAKDILAVKRAAQALPEGPQKTAALAKAKAAEDAILDYVASVDQTVASYNAVADEIKRSSGGLLAPQRVGLGAVQLIIGAAVILAVAVVAYQYVQYLRDLSVKEQAAIQAQNAAAAPVLSYATDALKSKQITAVEFAAIAAAVRGNSSSGATFFQDWGGSIFKTGLVIGAFYAAYKAINYYSHPRSGGLTA